MAKSHVTMTVNGKKVEELVEPRTLLIHFLREQLNITGPHIGCDTSHCGACTVLNFALGRRSQTTTDVFIEGLRAATAPQRFQITADGFQPYVSAITTTLSDRCDFAQLVKVYAQAPEEERRRYSPPDVTHAEKVPVMGNPDPAKICTSHVERQNLTIRMQMRRLTRLTNAFSKKWENLWAAYCLHFAWYNFVRVHQTLRVTPAMEAGITARVWGLADLLTA